jgi:hypothetical protein
MKHFLRAVSVLAALCAAQSASASCTTLIGTVPYVISAPGEYCLARSVRTTAAGNAITISSSNVTVDLLWHSVLSGVTDVRQYTVGVYSMGYNNITIRNGRIRGFTKAVEMQSDLLYAANYLVEGLIVRSSGQIGLDIRGGNSTIQDNVVSDTAARFAPTQFAIAIANSAFGGTAIIHNNRVDNTSGSGLVPPDFDGRPAIGAEGIVVDGAPSASIDNNTITDTTAGKDRALGLVYSCFPNAGVMCTTATAVGNEVLNSSSSRGAVGFTIVGLAGGGGAILNSTYNDVENFAEGIKYINATGLYRYSVVAGAVTPYVGGRPFGVNDIEP